MRQLLIYTLLLTICAAHANVSRQAIPREVHSFCNAIDQNTREESIANSTDVALDLLSCRQADITVSETGAGAGVISGLMKLYLSGQRVDWSCEGTIQDSVVKRDSLACK